MSTSPRTAPAGQPGIPVRGSLPLTRYRSLTASWAGRAFLAGAAVIAFHLIDDAFLEPAPGAELGDHLASGGATTTLVLLAVLMWPFISGSVQAVISLLLGALAAIVGILTHGRQLTDGDITVNHISGALMILGGLLLIGSGVFLTHRAIEKPVRRNLRWAGRRVLALVAIYVAAVYLAIPVVTAFFATHPRQADVADMNLGVAYEDVTFATPDRITLAGWFIPSRNGATIIALPGASNDRTGVADHAALLARHGYGVLLFDPRGMGESEGDPNQLGWATTDDIAAALDYLGTRDDVDPARIGAFGLSMGGEAVLQAAAETPNIRAVAAEGAGARSFDEVLLEPGFRKWIGLPATWLGYALTDAFSAAGPPPSLEDLMPRIAPRALLILYATRSNQAGESDLSPRYYAAAGEPKAIWAIDKGGHTDGLAVQPAEYESRVVGFFDEALTAR